MSNCSPNSISPSSSGGEFQKDMTSVISGLGRSPAHATSVPSHHCAVSPQDEASNDGLKNAKPQKYYFTSAMANEAVAEMNFESLLTWYLRKKEQANFCTANSTVNSERKRKGTNALEIGDTKRAKEATTINDIQKIGKEEAKDDHPLKQMERMTNSSALEISGIKDVVANNCAKNKEAERERNAKLEKLGEIESTLVSPQPTVYSGLQKQTSEPYLTAPNSGKEEWERLVGSGSGPSTSTAPPTQCPTAQSSPMYPPPSGAPLSAGQYPNIYPPYMPHQMGMNVPNNAGGKKSNSCSVNAAVSPRMMPAIQMNYPGYAPYPGWRHGMPVPGYPINPAYAQWHPQAMAKGVGNLSPGAYMNPAMAGGPPNQQGMPGYPPSMMAAGRMPPPSYGYPPNMPPHPGYQPPPGAMHPGMMLPRPGMPIDPSFNPYANYQPIQTIDKEATTKGGETTPVSDPVVAAS